MGLKGTIRSHPLAVLFGLAAISLLGLLSVPPIRKRRIYHGFADQRTLLGIPNFWNVVSNLPFMLVGAAWACDTFAATCRRGMFFLGVFLTGFSSSYYRWNPNDAGLFWDRLPMTVAFMAILSNVIEERIDANVGKAFALAAGCAWHRLACWCGCGPTTSGSTPGCSSSRAWCCR